MSITQFTIEEVRCFGERQTLEIRPLTFLVGENSTGKTTTLASFHVLANYFQGKGVNFNSHSYTMGTFPYSMGTFKDIVRNSRKKEKVFRLGFVSKHANEEIEWMVEFVEKKEGIEPAVSSIVMGFTDGEIIIRTKDNMDMAMRLESFDEEQNRYIIACDADRLNEYSVYFFFPPSRVESEGEIIFKKYFGEKIKKFEGSPWDIFQNLSVFSTSPIRSRPKRTYDPTREFDDPEGSDVPMYLMRVEATEKKNWEELKTQLVEFGRNSGLFENIDVRNLGRSLGAPFQLQVKVRGPKANIVDVGYGVSQILPILVQVLSPNVSGHEMSFSLLQQPEVHLHPRAQAELSSLLTKLANTGNRSFIVETHSDYMIDRARIDIIRGNILPEDVSLIYFEPKGNIVKVHNISFDKMANMVGVPPHYGEFFLKESKRLLGFKD